MSDKAAEDLRARVESAVRCWFADHAEAGETLTRIKYQLDVSYAEFSETTKSPLLGGGKPTSVAPDLHIESQ
jgi:hypothetical protein